MADNTGIEWADATQNFWTGCLKVSQGCKFCYMHRELEGRFKKDANIVTRTANATFNKPLTWKDPRVIFTCSWSDFFIKDADAWRDDAWDIIRNTPQHTYLVLTKRPERINACLPEDWGNGYNNVVLGVSIENEKTALYRTLKILEVKCKHRMLSIEPLLKPIAVRPLLKVLLADETWVKPFDWVIVGGESGNDTGKYGYRPTKKEWILNIVDQCKSVSVPVFVKQLGTHLAKELKLKDREGKDFEDPMFPSKLKVRELPGYITLKPKIETVLIKP